MTLHNLISMEMDTAKHALKEYADWKKSCTPSLADSYKHDAVRAIWVLDSLCRCKDVAISDEDRADISALSDRIIELYHE